jgi:Glycosyl transferase family 2
MTETISVAMTTFQGKTHLRRQLETILAQTRAPDEIVVGDDASSDGTAELLDELARTSPVPMVVQHNETRVGLRLNMQAVLERASGSVIVLADQDDLWAPDKVEAIEAALEDPDVTLWFSNAELVDAADVPMGGTVWQAVNFGPGEQERVRAGDGLDRLLYGQTVTGATMAFRASVLSVALPFPEELEGTNHLFLHDGWIAVVASLLGKSVVEPRPLTSYRQHPAQFTSMSMTPGVRESDEPTPGNRKQQAILDAARLRLVAERIRGMDAEHAGSSAAIAELLRRERFLAVRSLRRGTRHRQQLISEQERQGAYAEFSRGRLTALSDRFLPLSSRHGYSDGDWPQSPPPSGSTIEAR